MTSKALTEFETSETGEVVIKRPEPRPAKRMGAGDALEQFVTREVRELDMASAFAGFQSRLDPPPGSPKAAHSRENCSSRGRFGCSKGPTACWERPSKLRSVRSEG